MRTYMCRNMPHDGWLRQHRLSVTRWHGYALFGGIKRATHVTPYWTSNASPMGLNDIPCMANDLLARVHAEMDFSTAQDSPQWPSEFYLSSATLTRLNLSSTAGNSVFCSRQAPTVRYRQLEPKSHPRCEIRQLSWQSYAFISDPEGDKASACIQTHLPIHIPLAEEGKTLAKASPQHVLLLQQETLRGTTPSWHSHRQRA